MPKTNNPNFYTILILPLDTSRDGTLNAISSTPSMHVCVEGSQVTGMRAEQVLVHRDCDFNSNEFKGWFERLKAVLLPGARITII